jgi:hypothetical protein
VSNGAAPKTGTARPREGSLQSRTASQLQPAVPQVTKLDIAPRSQPKPASQAEQTRDGMSDIVGVSLLPLFPSPYSCFQPMSLTFS